MNNEIQPESADEDSQANNVVFHPQFEPGNKPRTHVSTINLTNNIIDEFDKKKVDCDKLQETYNLLYATWMELNKDYFEVKAENKNLLEENTRMNVFCQSLE